MSLFSKILEKLGLRKDKDDDQPAASKPTSAPVASPLKPTTPSSTTKSAADPGTTTAAKPVPACAQ